MIPERAHEPRQSASLLTSEQRHQLDDQGYAVLPGVLSPEECDVWSEIVDALWQQQRSAPKTYTEEQGVQFTPNLLRHSLLFERCISEAAVLEGVRTALGSDILLYLINARRADPGHGNQPLHDLKRQRGRPFSWCSTTWCLDEFTADNGSTRFIPSSHLSGEPFLSRCKDPLLPHPDECQLLAPRGSVVIFNSHLIHGGSTNRTGLPRRSVQATFTLGGQKSLYDWRELPPHIRLGLRPESLRLLAL